MLALNTQYVVLFASIIVALLIRLGYLIYQDAHYRGVEEPYPYWWALGTILIPFLILPLYGYYANRLGIRSEPIPKYDKINIWVVVTILSTVILAGFISPPDPFSHLRYSMIIAPIFLISFYILGKIIDISRFVSETQ